MKCRMAANSMFASAVAISMAISIASPSFAQNCTEWNVVGITGPSARAQAALAYDSGRGVSVLFGGNADNSHLHADTWEWNGSSWSFITDFGPGPRKEAAMVYDAARGEVVLFGGSDGVSEFGDTWTWNGTAWTLAATTGPVARKGHAMAYDGARGMVVLFGGFVGGQSPLSDSWEWNGSTWTEVKFRKGSPIPSGRRFHAMAFDESHSHVVLFGGLTDVGAVGDTWTFDGADWTLTLASQSGPSVRSGHAIAFDDNTDGILLFGGGDNQLASADTWLWNGSGWTVVANSGPSRREYHSMVFDSARHQALLFGAAGGSELWEWDGGSWHELISGPGARSHFAFAYDRARGDYLVHGGDSGFIQSDTWLWNGTAWRRSNSQGPGNRQSHDAAFDENRSVIVTFGGVLGEGEFDSTYEWNGTSWRFIQFGGPRPRFGHAMVYDMARELVMLFGGSGGSSVGEFQDTWSWDGGTWVRLADGGPPPRFDHAMAYDVRRDVTVLFGGRNTNGQYLGDTWEWNGSGWSQASTSGPAPRSGHAMTYDEARGMVICHGGYDRNLIYGDTWEWNGVSWNLLDDDGPRRFGHRMIYDSSRDVAVAFGGVENSLRGEIWELQYGAVFLDQPDDLTIGSGRPASFHVTLQVGGNLTYQWRRNGVPLVDGGTISGSQTDTLNLSRVSLADAGRYDCLVGVDCGSVLSRFARLVVIAPNLTADGTCPGGGAITVSWTDATPGGTVGIVFALNLGNAVIPQGYSCEGTRLGLGTQQLQLAFQGNAGDNGSRTIGSNAGPNACGRYLQLIDGNTCGVSNTVRIQ